MVAAAAAAGGRAGLVEGPPLQGCAVAPRAPASKAHQRYLFSILSILMFVHVVSS